MKKTVLLSFVAVLILSLTSERPANPPASSQVCSPFVLQAGAAPAETAKQAAVKNLSAAEADKVLRQKKEIVVLDVRTPEEFQAGHLAGATNLNIGAKDFAARLEKFDKKKSYLVYCRSGRRSSRARDLMVEQGFQTLYHLDGGINAWTEAGKPTAK